MVQLPFLWILVHTRFCVCPPRLNLCSLQSRGCPVIKSCWPARLDSLGSPSSFVRSSSWKPDVWSRAFTKVEFLWYYSSSVCGSPTRRVWDLILFYFRPLLPSRFGFFFVFGHRVSFFGGFQRPAVNGYSIAHCNFGVLAGGDESRLSTSPS